MKTTINIDKTALLRASNQGLNFYSFVIPQLIKLKEDVCENTHNPFYADKNPSLSIYFSRKTGRWMFKDYGGAPDGKDYTGDVFKFAKLYYESEGKELEFKDLLAKMVEDLGIDPATVESKVKSYTRPITMGFKKMDAVDYAKSVGFNLLEQEYASSVDDAFAYFSQYGITRDILLRYNTKAVRRYLYIDKEGALQTRSCSGALVIAYEDVYFTKMYQPSPKKFWHVGKRSPDYIFGFNQLLSRNRRSGYDQQETLIIAGGEKDVLTLTGLGYDAVCFNSETAGIPTLARDVLFHWYKRIIVMYDNDSTGVASTGKMVTHLRADFNVTGFEWGHGLKEAKGKDVSDYIKLGLDVEELRAQIDCCEGTGDIEDQPEPVTAAVMPNMEIPEAEEYTPCIPAAVYDDLPNFFKQLCNQFPDRRDKDVLLLSALGVVSSFFPFVYGEHDRDRVGANLYLFISAPPASGKGVMRWSRKLGSKIQDYLQQKYKKEMQAYEAELAAYNATGHEGPKPLLPQQQTMFIPGNISVSKIIQFLGANERFGVIMETEADALAGTFKNDWGNFSDILRSAFHHEPVSLARTATESKLIMVESSRLSVVLSGTFNQVNNLLDSVENGLFSRFLFYEFRSAHVWKNMFIQQESGSDLADLFDRAGEELLQWWDRQYNEVDCVVHLRPHHEDILNQYFAKKLDELISQHGDYIKASIMRAGLICYRIAIILAVVRFMSENDRLPERLYATDADFECALRIIDTLLYHVQRVYSRMEDSFRTSKLKPVPRALYEALPSEFTRKQFDAVADGLKNKYKTAERYLNGFIKDGLLERYGQGKFRKL
jgi:Protein of unknown function (DUF3987)